MIVSPDNYRVRDGAYVFTKETEPGVWEKSYAAWQECAERGSVMVVLVGLPQSGKSTWARANDSDKLAIFDSTAATQKRRSTLVALARKNGAQVHAVAFNASYKLCVERNKRREYGPLPDEVMERMKAQMHLPEIDEGFESLVVITPPPWVKTEDGMRD